MWHHLFLRKKQHFCQSSTLTVSLKTHCLLLPRSKYCIHEIPHAEINEQCQCHADNVDNNC